MLREKRVAEEEFIFIHQDNAGLSAKRSGTCIPGVLCVIGLILAIALLIPERATEPRPQPALQQVTRSGAVNGTTVQPALSGQSAH